MRYLCLLFVGVAVAANVGCSGGTKSARAGGPCAWVNRVPAGYEHYYVETYNAGVAAHLKLKGDGDTDLDLFVFDDQGRVVAQGTGLTDEEAVTFTPRVTGQYKIVVRNLGGVWNEYRLSTN